jgi:hypothetical protein
VQQVDQGALPEGPDAVEPPVDPVGDASAGRGQPSTISGNVSGTLAVDDGTVIDILVAYTQDALNGFGGDVQAQATIDLLIAETNQAFRNTGLNTQLRLVHATGVEYPETGDSSIDLGRLRTPGDGFLDDLLNVRDLHAADLVALITERTEESVCGRGYVGRLGSTGTFGFSVERRRCTNSGRTFAHEIGHNLGARHDWYVSANGGAYPYSKGYVSLPGRFRDLMAYYDLCRDTGTQCANLLAYSNPVIRQDGHPAGVPVGTNVTCTEGNLNNPPCDADIAATFRDMAPVVARFRNSRIGLAARQILPGGALSSDSGQYRLTYQTDGNLVLIDTVANAALWHTSTDGTSPGEAILQTDGNFVVYDGAGTARWSSGTGGHPNAYLVVQSDGNVVIFDSNDQPIWNRLGTTTPTPTGARITVSPTGVGLATATRFTFTAEGVTDPGGAPITYLWEFGDGSANPPSASQVSKTFDGDRSYTVRLLVTDGLSAPQVAATTQLTVRSLTGTWDGFFKRSDGSQGTGTYVLNQVGRAVTGSWTGDFCDATIDSGALTHPRDVLLSWTDFQCGNGLSGNSRYAANEALTVLTDTSGGRWVRR